MLKLIKDKQPFFKELFNLLYIYQKEYSQEKSIWHQSELKFREVFDIDKLHRTPANWYWFNEYYLKNPVFIDASLYGDLQQLCTGEVVRERGMLELQMQDLINANESVWTELLDCMCVCHVPHCT